MTAYRQHHYVPRFLLEQWQTPPDNKLSHFERTYGQFIHNRYKAKSVAKTEHLYSIEKLRDMAPNVGIEEKFFGPIVDDPASVAHKLILKLGVRALNDENKYSWSRFLVSLLLRTPLMVEEIRERGRKVLTKGLSEEPEEYLGIRGDTPEETLYEWVVKNMPHVLEDLGVMSLSELVQSKLLNGAVLKSTWAVRTFNDPRFDLLIGDNPLIYVGTFDTSFLLALPISPIHIFLAFNNPQTLDNLASRDEKNLIREANISSVSQANRYVYATNEKQRSFIDKYLRRN